MKKIAVLNGPNLNLLGTREPDVYGSVTLAEIETRLKEKAKALHVDLTSFQSNAEGELIDYIQSARGKVDCIIINAAALTHTSIGIRDALLATAIPAIEVHLSNIYKREPFRRLSYLSDIAVGMIAGFGAKSYELALEAACDYLTGAPGPRKSKR